METSYSAHIGDLDRPIKDAEAERSEGEHLRIRVQPSIWRRTIGQHRMWPGVSWTIECTSVQEALDLREALRAFFEAVARLGPKTLGEALAALQAPQSPP